MTPQDAPVEPMPAGAKVDAPAESPTPDETQTPDDGKITINFSDHPELAEMFKDCEPGETLTVDTKDDGGIVLAKEGYGGGGEQDRAGTTGSAEDTGAADDNPAVAAVIASKMKR